MTTLTHERDRRPRPASPHRPRGPLTWSSGPTWHEARLVPVPEWHGRSGWATERGSAPLASDGAAP